jgi:proteasome lid subunit RPN8/RPN11
MTFQPNPLQIAAAMVHASQCEPLESCGVITEDGAFHALKNTATEFDTFVMDMAGYLAINKKSRVVAIVHSHVYLPPTPSAGDKAMVEKTGLPWLIVSWPLGTWKVIEPCGYRAPLVGREWAWGSHDCFGLIRDGLFDETGILIPDFPREWMWWKAGDDLIGQQFDAAGFVRMAPGTPPNHCDVLGLRISSKVVNHLGLFLKPDVLLHQMLGRLSVRDVYGGFLADVTELHLRHKKLMEAEPCK